MFQINHLNNCHRPGLDAVDNNFSALGLMLMHPALIHEGQKNHSDQVKCSDHISYLNSH